MGLIFMNNNDTAYNMSSTFCNQKPIYDITDYKNFGRQIRKSVSKRHLTNLKALTKANRLFLTSLGYHVIK